METKELKCPICGEPTNVYMGRARKDKLCYKHGRMANKEEIKLNDNGEYVNVATGEILNTKQVVKKSEENNTNASNENNVITINEQNKSRCITCGKKTDGLLFCASCYHKYSNKELLFKITNCSSVELRDDSYEGRYTCKDGHIVKSKSERDIDNYLFEHDIPHAYEKALPYGAGEKEILHPDFYLPHYLGKGKHVYIEHWGLNENNLHYAKSKIFKISKYKELKITLVCTHEKTDTGDIETILDQKLNKAFIKENEINFDK